MSDIVIKNDSCCLRRMARCDLEMVRGWRNHLNVRRYMYTQHEISREEHHKWFSRELIDKSKYLLIFEFKNQPTGYVNLNLHKGSPIADWGFYLAPETEKGIGTMMGGITLKYCFEVLTLHKLCGQALAFNHKSIEFHKRLGFLQEGCLKDQYFDGEVFYDVCVFGLLAQEWMTYRSKNE